MKSWIFAVVLLASGLLFIDSTQPAQAQISSASITLNPLPNPVRASQVLAASGRVLVAGRPRAGVPVVIFARPFAGQDVVVGQGVTNANGNYTITFAIPARPGPTVQISAVSGGAPNQVARTAQVLSVR